MGTLSEDLNQIKSVEDTLTSNKVAQFAYTQTAYNNNDATGVDVYNVNNEQNIPSSDMTVLKVNETILTKGWRSQASSITRMLMNHFLGRLSYNLNKVNDNMSSLLSTLISHRGTANGLATLDENGRIPYSQLPESAMEYKGNWNAETNTPTLSDGTGDKGDFYVVQVAGTQNLGSGDIKFLVNDRVIYGQDNTWERLPAGNVEKVNNISPSDGNVTITGEDIKLSGTEDATIKASIGTMENLQTTDKSSLVSAINEVNDKEITLSGQISPRFTYVVDSDQKLLNWANNVEGNDYSAVLIRKGTWTSTIGVNLTTAGTKVVQGEPGSKLSFNAVEKGLYYDEVPTTSDYWMRDVSVENNSGNNSGNAIVSYGFYGCNNLINCAGTGTGTGTGTDTGITSGQGYGFYGCNNLTNCTGTGTGTGHGYISGSNTITGQGYGYGFAQCNNLTNCNGTGTGTITNTTTDTGQGYGFSGCNNLTNCVGTGTGTGATNDKGYGFSNCGNLTNCNGTGTGTGQGYGFNICYRLSGCKKGKKCSTSVFSNAFASFADAGMETYACANTPNGGFNDSTNY